MFLGFSIDAWITIATVLGLFSTLLLTKCRSDVAFLGAIGILFVTGVLDANIFIVNMVYPLTPLH